ncbi:MAG: hypothetical protein KAJ49_09250 [Arcobacteraceae bacterium]|nr:hypothetical protein [Arcobacteraceae bacterium]
MKLNSLSTQQQENQFEQDLNYEEYLKDNNPEPTSDEIDKMEQVFCSSVILKKSSLNPINTLNYQPLQGA